jgi:16S rRNA (cytosine1402-N4)-methyltransferase
VAEPDAAARHMPVLLQRCLDLLGPALQVPDAVMVDSTLGMGGHTEGVLAAFPHVRVIGLDRDPQALELAGRRLAPFGDRFVGVHAVYDEVRAVLDRLGVGAVQGVLMDLGVSSLQLDEPERGFSYAQDAPLDMRMDPTHDLSACDVVNTWGERELVTIFRRYGEERYAKQIARAIVRRRREQPFERTGELVDTIKCAIPAPARFGDGHPAKRVFQALRIAVNDELDSLAVALPAALEMLRPGGRLAVISFHSLEDRIVKRFLRERERGCTCPPDFPVCVCGHEPELRALQRRPIRPGPAELAANPRSASARLRAAVKTGAEEA